MVATTKVGCEASFFVIQVVPIWVRWYERTPSMTRGPCQSSARGIWIPKRPQFRDHLFFLQFSSNLSFFGDVVIYGLLWSTYFWSPETEMPSHDRWHLTPYQLPSQNDVWSFWLPSHQGKLYKIVDNRASTKTIRNDLSVHPLNLKNLACQISPKNWPKKKAVQVTAWDLELFSFMWVEPGNDPMRRGKTWDEKSRCEAHWRFFLCGGLFLHEVTRLLRWLEFKFI